MLQLKCPSCGSHNTQRLSIAVEGSTFSNQGTTFGAGVNGGRIGVLAASTKGLSKSKLAEKYAAPEKTPTIRGFLSIIIIAWIISLFAGALAFQIGFWIAAVAAVYSIYHNAKIYPREFEEWSAKYLCLRCSEVYAPDRTHPINPNASESFIA